MPWRYEVEVCADDVKDLRSTLARLTRGNGRVINVIWQPRRNLIVNGGRTTEAPSGYVVITEHEVAASIDAPREASRSEDPSPEIQ